MNGIFDEGSTSCFVPGLYQNTEDSQLPYQREVTQESVVEGEDDEEIKAKDLTELNTNIRHMSVMSGTKSASKFEETAMLNSRAEQRQSAKQMSVKKPSRGLNATPLSNTQLPMVSTVEKTL